MSKKIVLEGLDHFKDQENAMIASKPESTNTATVAHAVGEYFYWKGVLHIVTAAIAVGGTIQTNTNVKPAVLADDVSDLKESINNLVNSEGRPYLPTGYIKKYADASNTLLCTRVGNVITLKGARSAYPNYITLLDMTNRSSQVANYGTIDDFVDSLETGVYYITISGDISSETLTSGDAISFYACEYMENPTAIDTRKIGTVSISKSDYDANKQNVTLVLNVPAHTNPVRLMMLARYNNYDCTISFNFVNNKELNAVKALVLENIGG